MPLISRSQRLPAIDLLRGTVMLIMLLDHVRETFYLHYQVLDPMALEQTGTGLFLGRMLSHLCAPVFVFLTGLSAFLYRDKQRSSAAASAFLLKRGLFLVVLELTLVNFAWTFEFPPHTIYLQVIWVIGLSMIALAALLWLPRPALVALGVLLVAGHNLLDGLQVAQDSAWQPLWAVLHQREWMAVGDGLRLRTSYPLLPWIGVIALGYAAGPWFSARFSAAQRQRRLVAAGAGALLGFVLLRALNVYGDAPWIAGDGAGATLMSFFNVTKYPPSLLFLLLTLGIGLLLLRAFERPAIAHRLGFVAVFGAAPMFFYLLHLYVLRGLYLLCLRAWGANQGEVFGFAHVAGLWLATPLLALALYPAVRWFAQLKARRRDIGWLKYL
ncbi:DUF1624 domain-containing protein [Luteimonas salinilitoris]|uniref:DUF1624 domain-containing protein n=1 Tax=Luteimonas salinilitoris TaxID=3237697 RepID=A0ABV4HS91_9GAMM